MVAETKMHLIFIAWTLPTLTQVLLNEISEEIR